MQQQPDQNSRRRTCELSCLALLKEGEYQGARTLEARMVGASAITPALQPSLLRTKFNLAKAVAIASSRSQITVE